MTIGLESNLVSNDTSDNNFERLLTGSSIFYHEYDYRVWLLDDTKFYYQLIMKISEKRKMEVIEQRENLH